MLFWGGYIVSWESMLQIFFASSNLDGLLSLESPKKKEISLDCGFEALPNTKLSSEQKLLA